MVEDLRIEVRTRNNVLWHAIFDVFPSVAEFCRQYHLNQVDVGALLNLSASPLFSRSRTYRQVALTIASATGLSCEELFPPHLYTGSLSTRMVAEVSGERFLSLREARRVAIPASQDDALLDADRRRVVADALSTLTPREALVIRKRLGFDDSDGRSFVDIGVDLGVTPQRVREIEHKAMRKLSHPSRKLLTVAV